MNGIWEMTKNLWGFTLLLVLVVSTGVRGCCAENNTAPKNDNSQEEGGEVVLNERQKGILSEEGLPTEYGELRGQQQDAIVAIEELLKHLEGKYGIGFTYAGYVPSAPLDGEHLVAYPTGGDKVLDLFEAYRVDGEITDDYITVVIRPIYNDIVEDFVSRFFDKRDFKVFTEIGHTEIKELPVDPANLSSKIRAGTWIYIDSANIDKSTFDEFVNRFSNWMEENQFYGSGDLIYFEENATKYLSPYNHMDSLDTEKCLQKIYYSHCYDRAMRFWEEEEDE